MTVTRKLTLRFLSAAGLLELKETRVFPNLKPILEASDGVYLDARSENDVLWASLLKSWLELASAGSHEREAPRS